MKTNQEYKNAALAALKGNWAPFVVAMIIMMAFMYVVMGPYLFVYQVSLGMHQIVISPAFAFAAVAVYILGMPLLAMPLTLGFNYASNRLLVEGDNRAVGNLFRDSFGNWGRKVWGMFLMNFFVSLWSLLLIIPGFIKYYAYALTPYILIDNPELSANQAINLSQKMMKGHKFDMFILHLSFIGWIFFSIFTFGIGLLWLLPYMMTAQAAFYQDVKKEYNK